MRRGTRRLLGALALCAAPAAGRNAALDARRLLEVEADKTWAFPQYATLKIGSGAGSYVSILLAAMVQYLGLEIETSSGYTFGAHHASAKVKLVPAGTTRDQCSLDSVDMPMSTVVDASGNVVPSALALGQPLALSNAEAHFLTASSGRFRFMQGGSFQLCYAPDGTFAASDTALLNAVFHTVIQVIGVASSCRTQNCLQAERWDCSFGYKGLGSPTCQFVLSGSSARPGWSITHVDGGSSRISWTSAFGADTLDGNGAFVSEAAQACAETSPDTVSLENVAAGEYGINVASGAASMPKVATTATESFALGICYCPNRKGIGSGTCADRSDYVQPFGRLYYWTIKLCDDSGLDASCANRYGQVFPQQPFRVRVDCPPGGACTSGVDSSRLRMRDSTADMSRQNWDPQQGCRTAGESASTSALIWEGGSSVSGGTRADYKDFQGSVPLRLRLPMGASVEVCYCDKSCADGASWLHIGRVQAAGAISIATSTPLASGDQLPYVQYAGKPGGLGFVGGVISSGAVLDPYDSQRFGAAPQVALLNLVSYDRLPLSGESATIEATTGGAREDSPGSSAALDAACRRELYSASLVSELATPGQAAALAATANADRKLLAFDGAAHDRSVTVLRAGLAAVCYCALTTTVDGTLRCDVPGEAWIFAGMLLVRGPRGDQTWTVAVGAIFGMTFEGWGFEDDDRIRLLGPGQDCAAGGTNDPASTYSTLFLQCPSVDGSACTQAPSKHNILLKIVHSSSGATPVYITKADVSASKTTLTFSASIASTLRDGDTISLSLDQIRVGGRAKAAWSRADAYNANRLAGLRDFANDAATQPRLLGHKVSLVAGVNDQATIPVGWSTDPVFSFASLQGTWKRHSAATSPIDMQASEPAENLAVCWAAATHAGKYYTQAGRLNVVEPPGMASASLSLTATQQGAFAPVVVAFGTKSSATEYAAATSSEGMSVRIAFLDSHPVGGKLGLAMASGFGSSGAATLLAADAAVATAAGAQSVCGSLFVEMWSNDDMGFPMPQACYYGRSYRYLNTTASFREVFMTFGPGSGLKHRCTTGGAPADCEYQLVVNAQLGAVATGDRLVDVDTSCLGCASSQTVWERGRARASAAALPRAGATEPQLARIDVLDTNTAGVFSWAPGSKLRLRLTGAATAAQAVTAGAQLRLYLWPLTAWVRVGDSPACTASCTPQDGVGPTDAPGDPPRAYRCGPEVSCSLSSVAGSRHSNLVTLVLPDNIDPIVAGLEDTIGVSLPALPPAGWFPTRFGIQLTDASGQKPVHTVTSQYTAREPSEGASVARLVVTGRTGGGSRPYAGERQNLVLLWLRLGATLRQAQAATSSELQIALPAGYKCSSEVSSLSVALPGSDPAILAADADSDSYVDYTRTQLSYAALSGSWAPTGTGDAVCGYRLAENMVVYQGSALFVQILVDNPSTAYSKQAAENVWKLELVGKGFGSELTRMPVVSFSAPAGDPGLANSTFAANFAVLGVVPPLSQSMFPGSFAAGATHSVSIVFTTTLGIDQVGSVVVDAPVGYDFGAACQARDLDPRFYMSLAGGVAATRRLEHITACQGGKWPVTSSTSNRAGIAVSQGLLAGTSYAFALSVKNPAAAPAADANTWHVWALNSGGHGVEGTQVSPRLSPSQAAAWQLYAGALTGLQVALPGGALRPTSLAGAPTKVQILGISSPASASTTLRVIAPSGFAFLKGAADFRALTAAESSAVTATLPLAPAGGVAEELLWAAMALTAGSRYGFEVNVNVPNELPTRSSQAFFVEVGYDKAALADRLAAGLVSLAPPLQALTNCSMDYFARTVGYPQNHLRLGARLATAVPTGGTLQVQVDTAGFVLRCPDLSTEALPQGSTCFVNNTGRPQIVITAGAAGLPAALYAFEVTVGNPAEATAAGQWTFATFRNDVRTAATPEPLDKSATIPGFSVAKAMAAAGLVDAKSSIGRNDRPLERNRLAFILVLLRATSAQSSLRIRGPDGFAFDDFCLGRLSTDAATFLRNVSNAASWPAGAAFTSCRGHGPVAHATLGPGLAAGGRYAFAIDVASNAVATPARNAWTLELAGEPSEPFPGFDIATFVAASVTPVVAVAAGASLPITVAFRAHSRVPAPGGVLVLDAPAAYAPACEAELIDTGAASPARWDPDELRCTTSGAQLRLELLGSRALEAAVGHHLAVRALFPGSGDATPQAGEWRLRSFASADLAAASALDDARLAGFLLGPMLPAFEVRNGGEVRGALPVAVTIRVAPAGGFIIGDALRIFAPQGMAFARQASGTCEGFAWVGTATGAEDVACSCELSGVAAASARAGDCAMSWTQRAQGTPVPELHFVAKGLNPSSRPRVGRAFWVAEVWRGGALVAAAAAESWNVDPQLPLLTMSLPGPRRAAGSTTRLSLQLQPGVDAAAVELHTTMPGFDLSGARAEAPLAVIAPAAADRVAVAAAVVASQRLVIILDGVVLPSPGGPATFHVRTFSSRSLLAWREELRDFTLSVPGNVNVSGTQLLTRFVGLSQNPVLSTMPMRVGDTGWLEVTFSITIAVEVGQALRISSVGSALYGLSAVGFELSREAQRVPSRASQPDSPQSVHAVLEQAMDVGVAFRARCSVKPLFLGASRWTVETLGATPALLPSNTNDFTDAAFTVLPSSRLTVSTVRAPPSAIVSVAGTVGAIPAGATLLLVAPSGYSFLEGPGACGRSYGHTCTAAGVYNQHASANLTLNGTAADDYQFVVQVVLPKFDAVNSPWFLLCFDTSGQLLSWGSHDGFALDPLSPIAFYYTAVLGRSGVPVVGAFSVTVAVGGSRMIIQAPKGLRLRCQAGAAVLQAGAASNAEAQCEDNSTENRTTEVDGGQLAVVLSGGELGIGKYTVAFLADMPGSEPQAATEAERTWSAIVYDTQGLVTNSAFGVLARPLVDIEVGEPRFSWSHSSPDSPSDVTFALDFSQDVEGVAVVLFVCPERIVHDARSADDVQLFGGSFPSAGADVSQPSVVRVFVEANASIPSGPHRFQFRVLLPRALPVQNVWRIVLCSSVDCQSPEDLAAMLTFTLPGFSFGQVSDIDLSAPVSRAGLQRRALLALCLPFLACFLRHGPAR